MLLATGAVQLHPPVALAQALHPLLQLLLRSPGDGERQRAAQERRAVAAAEHGLQLARGGGALGALHRGAVIARLLLAGDLVGVDLAPRGEAARLGVGQVGGREDGVDGELELQRREHQLGGGAGDDRFLRHRAEHQQRLVGAAALAVDHEAAAIDLDAALVQAQQIVAVGLEALLAPAVEEGEGLGGEGLVGVGLAEAAGVGAADERRQLARADAARWQVGRQALVGLLLGAAQRGELGIGEAALSVEAEAGGEGGPQLAEPGERAGAARCFEPHREVDLRAQRLARFEGGAVLGEVALEAGAMAVTGVEGRERAAHVGVGVEAAREAEQLKVGFDRVREGLQALADFDLAALGEPRVAVALELVDGPGVGRGAQDEVAPEEVVRGPHRGGPGSKTTVRPAGISRVRPRCRGVSPAWLKRQRRAAADRSERLSPVPLGTPSRATRTG